MAQFLGMVKGQRQAATRLGTGKSGLQVSAQSWQGSVQISMYTGTNGETMVSITTGEGSTSYGTHEVFRGSLAQLNSLNILKK